MSRVDTAGRLGYNRRITRSSFARRLLAVSVTFLLLDAAHSSAASPAAIEEGSPHASSAILVDLDGDGLSDSGIAEADGVRLDLTRAGRVTLEAPSAVSAVAAVDLDGDGDPDLVALPARGTTLIVWRNDGAGRFSDDPGKSPARRTPADGMRSTLDGSAGGNSAEAASGTPRGFDAHSLEKTVVHVRDHAGHAASLTARLHLPPTPPPGSARGGTHFPPPNPVSHRGS